MRYTVVILSANVHAWCVKAKRSFFLYERHTSVASYGLISMHKQKPSGEKQSRHER